MYCKSCGSQLNDEAKFCTSCGSKVEMEQVEPVYEEYIEESPENETPRQFGYNDSLQESTGMDTQKSNFYGKQFSTGTSGGISFNNQKRKSGLFKKLIGGVFIVIVLIFIYSIFFSDNGPIYDLVLGVDVDLDTYYPLDEDVVDYIIASEGSVFISYTTRDLEVGTSILVEWYDVTFSDTLVCTENLITVYEEEIGFVPCYNNWTVGDYEIRFSIDNEVLAIKEFEVAID